MARRSIKNAKTPRRQPIVSNSAAPQQQSMSFGGGASLFGNSLPQSNTFNFAAPAAPSISFPTPSINFGNQSSPEHSESEESANNAHGHRADPTGEEAKRRNKEFRSEATPQKVAQTSFGNSTTSNIFGNIQSTPNPFSFGAQPAAPSTTFGSTPGNAQSGSNPFSFGASQQPAPSTSSINTGFGFPQAKPVDMNNAQRAESTQAPSSTPNLLFGGGSTSTSSQPFQFSNPVASTQPPGSYTLLALSSNNEALAQLLLLCVPHILTLLWQQLPEHLFPPLHQQVFSHNYNNLNQQIICSVAEVYQMADCLATAQLHRLKALPSHSSTLHNQNLTCSPSQIVIWALE